MTLLLCVFDAWLRLRAWWERIDEPISTSPRPQFWGFCMDCLRPGPVTRHWACAQCGSESVMNVRAGGTEALRA